MKFLFIILIFLQSLAFAATECDNTTIDSLIEKQTYVLAKRYGSKKVGIGVSIKNETSCTTSIILFDGRGGNDGVLVDRIGTITVDLQKCAVQNSLIGVFETINLN
jgi:hypothetical protein